MKWRNIQYGWVLCLAICTGLSACHPLEEHADNPSGNFDALWSILDEHYCFFDYKQIDWNDVRRRYRARVSDAMTEKELFALCDEMLMELKDGHVNLSSAFNTSRYWAWFQDYPENYDERLIDKNYLNFDFLRAGGIKYQILRENIGYMYYGSFSDGVGEGNLDYIIDYFALSDGLIIDVRNNGGGNLTNVETIASRFTDKRILTGYIRHKTGPGHSDFSDPYPIYLDPSDRLHYLKPVVVLTNRSTYSAANDFVKVMSRLPGVTVIGDCTGGGSGLPFSSELPNGWSIRFSASPMYDDEMNQTEWGIEPDEFVDMTLTDMLEGRDTILDRAIEWLLYGY